MQPGIDTSRPDCSGFDISGCVSAPTCGNSIIEDGETCQSFRFSQGALACQADCSANIDPNDNAQCL